MTTNVGTIDRIARAALGVVLLYLAVFSGMAVFSTPLVAYITGAIGVVMLATAAMKMCPLYALLGIKTCREC